MGEMYLPGKPHPLFVLPHRSQAVSSLSAPRYLSRQAEPMGVRTTPHYRLTGSTGGSPMTEVGA